MTPGDVPELLEEQALSSSVLGGQIGTFKHLPPTLTLQYHFAPGANVRPYVGAGVNYTRFSSVNLPAGVDIKKVQIRTDVLAAGAKIGAFKADPLLIGVGLGWRF